MVGNPQLNRSTLAPGGLADLEKVLLQALNTAASAEQNLVALAAWPFAEKLNVLAAAAVFPKYYLAVWKPGLDNDSANEVVKWMNDLHRPFLLLCG
jgi:hypothetical protein